MTTFISLRVIEKERKKKVTDEWTDGRTNERKDGVTLSLLQLLIAAKYC